MNYDLANRTLFVFPMLQSRMWIYEAKNELKLLQM